MSEGLPIGMSTENHNTISLEMQNKCTLQDNASGTNFEASVRQASCISFLYLYTFEGLLNRNYKFKVMTQPETVTLSEKE